MAKIVDPKTGGLSFESREDLSPEFDVEKPLGYKWGFELPVNVDFYYAGVIHRSASDIERIAEYFGEVDLLLCESTTHNAEQELLYEELSKGNAWAYKILIGRLKDVERVLKLETGYSRAELELVFRQGIRIAALDPFGDHAVFKNFDRSSVRNMSRSAFDLDLIRGRDLWALHNIKKIVDEAISENTKTRRRVLITRGFVHLGLLQALEWQIDNNPKKANGSRILASTLIIPGPEYGIGAEELAKITGYAN